MIFLSGKIVLNQPCRQLSKNTCVCCNIKLESCSINKKPIKKKCLICIVTKPGTRRGNKKHALDFEFCTGPQLSKNAN